jgi:hypothetical protein
MVEAFKTEKNETIYAVTDARNWGEVLKQIASYKKESLTNVKRKFKKSEAGYFIQKGKNIELYAGKAIKGSKSCIIVRR